MNTEINVENFKEKLLAEQSRLETDLSSIARINPDNPSDWEPVPDNEFNDRSADPNKAADGVEEYEARTATVKELEASLKDVRDALTKIEEGKFGVCEVSGMPIEADRLEANPAARTCKAHMNDAA